MVVANQPMEFGPASPLGRLGASLDGENGRSGVNQAENLKLSADDGTPGLIHHPWLACPTEYLRPLAGVIECLQQLRVDFFATYLAG